MPLHEIDATQLKEWLDKEEAIVVDVREPAEYDAECIAQSVLIPLATISKDTLPDIQGKKLVIHCQLGGRSEAACKKLLAEDPTLEAYHLMGGMAAWKKAGYAVKTFGKFFLSLDRQVQTIIGACVLLGVILGYAIHPGFFLLSGFFGAGLIFAGLSGRCTLTMLVAKMPWNQKS